MVMKRNYACPLIVQVCPPTMRGPRGQFRCTHLKAEFRVIITIIVCYYIFNEYTMINVV